MFKKSLQYVWDLVQPAVVDDVSYPTEILSHSGRVLPVSDGGIVVVNDPKDCELIAIDGITAVELDRQLSDDFYETAWNADEALVEQLDALFIMCAVLFHLLDKDIRDFDRHRQNRDNIIAQNPNAVIEQADFDIDQFSGFSAKISERLGYRDDKGFNGVGLDGSQNSGWWHVDIGFVIRGLFPYVGSVASLIDDRVNERVMRHMLSRDRLLSQEFDSYKKRPARIGNPIFIKGTGMLNSEFSDVVSALSNLSIHKGPQPDFSQPRYTFALE